MLSETQKVEIVMLANEAAKAFVSEFHIGLDSSKTDWDAVAWNEDMRKLYFSDDLRADAKLYGEAWKIYQEALEILSNYWTNKLTS